MLNYKKFERQNVFQDKFAHIYDPSKLQRVIDCVNSIFVGCVDKCKKIFEPNNWFGYLSSFVVSTPNSNFLNQTGILFPPLENSAVATALITLYELVSCNKTFLAQLLYGYDNKQDKSPEMATKTLKTPTQLISASQEDLQVKWLPNFFSFCSFCLNDLGDTRLVYYAKLNLIILLIFTQDRDVLELLHNQTQQYSVPILYKSKKKVQVIKAPLVSIFLEILVQFLRHNYKKKTNLDMLKCDKTRKKFHRENRFFLFPVLFHTIIRSIWMRLTWWFVFGISAAFE